MSIEGEVYAPGVYQLQPGETLKQLMNRAGGVTPQAYLYGLEFTREETRRKQRENLDTAIARLDAMAATQVAKDNERIGGAGGTLLRGERCRDEQAGATQCRTMNR